MGLSPRHATTFFHLVKKMTVLWMPCNQVGLE
jgi:hypothetical protein